MILYRSESKSHIKIRPEMKHRFLRHLPCSKSDRSHKHIFFQTTLLSDAVGLKMNKMAIPFSGASWYLTRPSHPHRLTYSRHAGSHGNQHLMTGVWLYITKMLQRLIRNMLRHCCPDWMAGADTIFAKFQFLQNIIISNKCCQFFTLKLWAHAAKLQISVFQAHKSQLH